MPYPSWTTKPGVGHELLVTSTGRQGLIHNTIGGTYWCWDLKVDPLWGPVFIWNHLAGVLSQDVSPGLEMLGYRPSQREVLC